MSDVTQSTGAPGASSSTDLPDLDDVVDLHPHVRARAELTAKKFECLDHMQRSMDIITYCHFSYMYFLDISLLRFMIRTIVQINLFAPKPPNFPAVQRPQKRSALVAIFGSTLICFLIHLLSSPPSAGEASNGYLHGGLLIDFIGQEGPISKFRLLLLDLIILLLQLVMLATKIAKEDLTESAVVVRAVPVQDLDSEERGEDRAVREAREEEERLMAAAEVMREEEPEVLVDMYSGEVVVADLRIMEMLKRQWDVGNNVGSVTAAPVDAGLRRRR